MKRDQVQAYIDQRVAQRAGVYRVELQGATQVLINGHQYELVQEYRDGFDAAKLADRFSNVLTKYDYIVGDWGHTQLRLRGFYAPDNQLYEPAKGMELIPQYLQEECNFGCAFFILQNHEVVLPRMHRTNQRSLGQNKRGKRNGSRRSAKGSFVEKRRRQNRPKPQQRKHQEVKTVTDHQQPSKRKFVIRDKKRGN